MKKDKHKTKVQFLFNVRMNELFAYFPEEDYNNEGLKMCYVHVGQHCGCHPDYAKESREATKNEYKDLKIELENLGYILEIVPCQLLNPTKKLFKVVKTESIVSETLIEAESAEQAIEIAESEHVSFGKEELQHTETEAHEVVKTMRMGRIIHTETGYINGDGTVVEC